VNIVCAPCAVRPLYECVCVDGICERREVKAQEPEKPETVTEITLESNRTEHAHVYVEHGVEIEFEFKNYEGEAIYAYRESFHLNSWEITGEGGEIINPFCYECGASCCIEGKVVRPCAVCDWMPPSCEEVTKENERRITYFSWNQMHCIECEKPCGNETYTAGELELISKSTYRVRFCYYVGSADEWGSCGDLGGERHCVSRVVVVI
jgi:hypothetical protein